MNKLKKQIKRDSLANQRKILINTVPSSYLIEEIRIPTGSSDIKGMGRSLELRNLPKSIELRKAGGGGLKKKVNPRKNGCKVMKTAASGSQALKTISQTFKQLKQIKLSHQKYRSKSKSPTFKSRSASKLFPKKKSVKINQNNSERLFGMNLQKTIKQINMKGLLNEEDSLVIESNSSRRQPPAYYNILSENEDSINLSELKNYCTQNQRNENTSFSLGNNASIQQNRAAYKIQVAWKRYRTKKLVERYSSLFQHGQRRHHLLQSTKMNQSQLQHQTNPNQQIIVTFQDNKPQEAQKKSKYLKQNDKKIVSGQEDMVQRFKRQQLERWDEIINIISLNKGANPTDISKLLERLREQSQNNKRNIQALTSCNQKMDCKKQNYKQMHENHEKQPIIESHQKGRFEYSSSDRSIENNQYDNKKYIEFLDSDIFPNQFSMDSPKIAKQNKISEAKQQLLLQKLKSKSPATYTLNHSKSLKRLGMDDGHVPNSTTKHRRSISEKGLFDPEEQFNLADFKGQHYNVDKLIENFLQGQDPHEHKSQDRQEQAVRIKITKSDRLKQEYEEEQNGEFLTGIQVIVQDQEEDMTIMKRSPPAFSLHRGDDLIKMEAELPQSESFEQDFESNSEEDENARNVKYQTCATIILDKLIFQTLKDIAKADNICEAFKNYSRSQKQQKNKTQPVKKKKGFSTSKAQIELFLTTLLNFLQKEEPRIFKNLEVPTGPSAIEMLRFMHQHVQEEEDSDDENEAAIMVIPNRIFDGFWHLKEKSIIIEIPQVIDQTTNIFRQQLQLLKSLNKIFYRCMFDTFNECLDCERNFGQYGRPFPWKRAATFSHQKSMPVIQSHIKNARKRMMDLSTIYCGLIVEKQDIGTIDEEYIKQIHQQRLSRMLAGDFLQLEQRWIFYDDEETQILVEISHFMFVDLIIEAMQDLSLIT